MAVVEREVVSDVYTWSTEIEVPGTTEYEYHIARKGDTITVSDAEAARGEALGALAE